LTIIPVSGGVTREEREKGRSQRGCVVWLTGLSGSGKSTIAAALERRLIDEGCSAYLLDGDNLRTGINSDLGFSEEDRHENVRRVGEIAALFAEAGIIAIASLISPFSAGRAKARARAAGRFVEVFVSTPLEVCEARDVKGLYARARAGEIPHFTGISSPYEPPVSPELVIDSTKVTPEEAVNLILSALEKSGMVGASA
jgi:adenylylsulfate kinase